MIGASRSAGAEHPGSGGVPPDQRYPTYHQLVRIIERMHRSYLDLMRLELNRLGIDDISPVQVVMLQAIGEEEISVRDLVQRGHYLGSNASYNLKLLVEAGYVERSASQRDRRVARLKLSPKGRQLFLAIRRSDDEQAAAIIETEEDGRLFEGTYRTLRRLERSWITAYDTHSRR